MRLSHLAFGAAVVGGIACARGMDVDFRHVNLADAGPIVTPIDESGGSPGSGGMEETGSGGASSGGSGPGGTTGMGGKPATGGASTGGKATGGDGGKATGGMTGMGGSTAGTGSGGKATGGTTGSGGMVDPGDAGGNCPAGQKFCGGLCTPPAPRVGCSATGCDACTITAPTNGYITCASNQCVFDCLSGYKKNVDKCEGTGAGGNGGNCNPISCPQTCSVVFGPACCTSAGKCGCPLVPWVAPTCI